MRKLLAPSVDRLCVFKSTPQAGDHGGMFDDVLAGRLRIADDLAAGVQIGPCQQPDVWTILPRDQRVLDHRRRRRDGVGAQRADMNERACGELEILHDPASEDDAGDRIVGVDEHAGIADAIEAFLIERRFGEIRPAEIAGRDVDAAQP